MPLLDFFQHPVTIFINKSSSSSTLSGKLMSLFIIGFLIYCFATSDLVNKTNLQSTSQDIKIKNRPKFILAKENFSFCAGVTDDGNSFSLGVSYLEINITFCHKEINENKIFCERFAMEPCKPDHFNPYPEDFMNYNLNGSYCIPKDVNISLNGYWDNSAVSYFYVDLWKCVNTTKNGNYCKPSDQIEKFFNYFAYFNVFLTNQNIDATNYENPITRKLTNYFQMVDNYIYKQMILNVKHATIDTHEGILLDEIDTKKTMLHGELTTDIKYKGDNWNSNIMSSFNLYSDDCELKITRRYQRIQDLLAKMGGICNFLWMVGFFLSKVENYYKIILKISNEIFLFQSLEKNIKSPPKQKDFHSDDSSGFRLNKSAQRNNNKSNFFPHIDDRNADLTPKRSPRFIEMANRSLDLHNDTKSSIPESSSSVNQNILSFPVDPKIVKEDEIVLQEKEKNEKESKDEEIKCDTPKATPRKLKDLILGSKIFNFLRTDKTESENEKLKNFNDYLHSKKKQNYFSLGFCGFVKLLIKQKRFRLSKKEKLYIKAENQIIRELDILTILKSLQEINKLKRLLLTEEQLYLFNLLSKPMIVLEKERGSDIGKTKVEDRRYKYSVPGGIDMLEKAKILKCYNDIKCRAESAGGTEIDKKMIRLLDEDVLTYLQSD